MKYKVTSYGVNLGPNEGTSKGYNIFCMTEEEALQRAQEFLKGLSPGQQQKAYVKVMEIKDVLIAEIHTAAEKGPNREVLFAIARP